MTPSTSTAPSSDMSRSVMMQDTTSRTLAELVLDFWDPSRESTHTAHFFERPLGIEFIEWEPVIVRAVVPNSPAEQAGVQRHMLLRAVNGTKVQVKSTTDLPDYIDLLRSVSESLPKRSGHRHR